MMNHLLRPTMARISPCKRIVLCAIATVLLIGNTAFADVSQPPVQLPTLEEVNCASYYCYDRTTDTELIAKEPDARIYPASMTKILTISLAMEYLDPNAIVTVSQTAMDATTPNSTLMGLVVGEEVLVSELYYGLLLPSGNDAANVLAEEITKAYNIAHPAEPTTTPEDGTTPTEEPSLLSQYTAIVNAKIAELGLTNTHFVNPNGLHNDEHYTTARELAQMFDYALSFPDFRTVINTPSHAYKATNKHTFDGWAIARNTNFLLNDPWILGADTNVAQVVGGKTGTTIVAGTGMTLLTVNKNGDEVITVVCGIPYELASHQTTYVATVVNAGADACFANDPNVRVSGNVMDYRPYNAPEGMGPEGISGDVTQPTQTPSDPGTEPSATTEETKATNPYAPIISSENDDGKEPSFFTQHPVWTTILAVIGVVIVGLILFTIVTAIQAQRRKKRRNKNGIKRI